MKIKTSFEMSVISVQYNMKSHLFSELRGRISKFAPSVLADEGKWFENVGVNVFACGCAYR